MGHMSVVFFGTSSGGGPSESRNCSSLVCDMLADYSLWMVDCAEGTTRQFALQPPSNGPALKIHKVTKIFITHMHADHIMGIISFLRNVLYPPRIGVMVHTFVERTIELYGPAGLRAFVRQNLKMTLSRMSDTYIVHELLRPEDPVTPCDDAPKDSSSRMDATLPNVMHFSELPGSDFLATPDGFWRGITRAKGRSQGVDIIVDAGPILHRDPCLGYVFKENGYPSRKLVILGDTYDPSAMIPLCHGASLLVHEATDSHISPTVDPSGRYSKRTPQVVLEKALSRGHSVPEMAGSFARTIGAKALVLNHIGSRFPAPRHPRDVGRLDIMHEIERHANEAWMSGNQSVAAYDFMRVDVPIDYAEDLQLEMGEIGSYEDGFESSSNLKRRKLVDDSQGDFGGPSRGRGWRPYYRSRPGGGRFVGRSRGGNGGRGNPY